MNPFDYVTSVSFTKKDMMRGTENDDLAEKGYNAYLTNRSFSLFADTILYANEMNQLHHLRNIQQYDYYLHSLRKRKRFKKWHKNHDDEVLSLICETYKCNRAIGKQYQKLLSDEQIEVLKQKQQKGGVQNGKR